VLHGKKGVLEQGLGSPGPHAEFSFGSEAGLKSLFVATIKRAAINVHQVFDVISSFSFLFPSPLSNVTSGRYPISHHFTYHQQCIVIHGIVFWASITIFN
jgi:hypothetical protein